MSTATPNPDDGRPGRPPKLTKEVIDAAVALLIQGNFRCVVAKRLNVDPGTFRRWMRLGRRHRYDFPDGLYARFYTAVLAAETEFESRAVGGIVAAGADDARHLEWLLERKYPQRWGRFRGELGEIKRKIAELEALFARESPAGEAEESAG